MVRLTVIGRAVRCFSRSERSHSSNLIACQLTKYTGQCHGNEDDLNMQKGTLIMLFIHLPSQLRTSTRIINS